MDETQGTPIPPEAIPPMGEWELIKAVFTEPSKAFEEIARKPRYVTPAIIIGIGYLIYSFSCGTLATNFIKSLGTSFIPGAPQSAGIAQIASLSAYASTVCCFPFQAAASWFIWTTVVFLGCMIAGSKERYWPLFSAMGYAWIPYFFALIIGTFTNCHYSSVLSHSVYANITAAMPAMLHARKVELLILAIFSIWNVILCIIAVEKTMNISRGSAAAVIITLKVVALLVVFAGIGTNMKMNPSFTTPRYPGVPGVSGMPGAPYNPTVKP